MLRRLFGGRDAKAPEQEPGAAASPAASTMRLTVSRDVVPGGPAGSAFDAQGVYWEARRSASGRFTLLWRDAPDEPVRNADGSSTIGGHRSSGPGAWRLLDGDRVRAQGRLERPNEGVIADDGTFAIADWLFTDGLEGVFHVFDADGASRIADRFRANLNHPFLSPDGRYAAVECLANDKDATDADIFTLYDVRAGTRLWRRLLVTGRATSVTFDPDASVIVTAEPHGPVTYRLSDGWTDEAAARELILRKGKGDEVLGIVRDELAAGAPTKTRGRTLVAACDRAGRDLAHIPKAAARAQRLAGEVLEATGDETGALGRWDAALALDPSVGIRKRADALRARLGA